MGERDREGDFDWVGEVVKELNTVVDTLWEGKTVEDAINEDKGEVEGEAVGNEVALGQ